MVSRWRSVSPAVFRSPFDARGSQRDTKALTVLIQTHDLKDVIKVLGDRSSWLTPDSPCGGEPRVSQGRACPRMGHDPAKF